MNKKTGTLLLAICFFCKAQSQQMYINVHTRFHQSISSQPGPQYFGLDYVVVGVNILENTPANIKNFSIASGFKYGGTLGYQLNNVLGIETGIDYFSTKRTINPDINSFSYDVITKWKYYSIQATPAVTVKKTMNKKSLSIKAGMIIGVAWLNNTLLTGDYNSKTYQLEKHLTFGYTMGIEYNYRLSSVFSFLAECGLEHSSFTPSKAKLEAIKFLGDVSVQDQNEYLKKIKYVSEVRNQEVTYDYNNPSPNSFVTDQNKPQSRIKQSIHFNTAYLGIGLKYNIGHYEKK